MALNPVQQPLEFKGRMTTLTVVRVLQPQLDLIEDQLKSQLERVPGFFQGLPLLLELVDESVDLKSLTELMRHHGLCPVAVYASSNAAESAARAVGLGVLRETRAGRNSSYKEGLPKEGSTKEDLSKESSASAMPDAVPASEPGANVVAAVAAPAPKPRASTRIVTLPVRSGQQIYARDGDLIVMASVGAGAEVLADGCIHIYGALRGRALAGVQGDASARVFCQQLNAELVSVAGCYKISEDIKDSVRGRAVQVYLEGESLKIEAL